MTRLSTEVCGRQPAPGASGHGELTNRRKDGRCYLEEMSITPVRDADGRITAYVAIKQDVTATRAAADSQGLLASIVECSEDAIIAYTTAAIIVSWNRSAEKLFGYSAIRSGPPIAHHPVVFPGYAADEVAAVSARVY